MSFSLSQVGILPRRSIDRLEFGVDRLALACRDKCMSMTAAMMSRRFGVLKFHLRLMKLNQFTTSSGNS
jgi:hypothetical protein